MSLAEEMSKRATSASRPADSRAEGAPAAAFGLWSVPHPAALGALFAPGGFFAGGAPNAWATMAPPPWFAAFGSGAAPAPTAFAHVLEPWFAAFGFDATAMAREAASAMLYDIGRLGARDRAALAAPRDLAGRILVAHPGGRRPVAVYASAVDLGMSVDAPARVLAVAAPGATPLGVAAFARAVADGMREPAIAVASAFAAEELATDLAAALLFGGIDDAAHGAALRIEEETLVDLMVGHRAGFRLAVSHGLGARTLARAIAAHLGDGRRRRGRAAEAPDRVVTLGAAPRLSGRIETLAVVGAADAFGWAMTDPAAVVLQAPLGVGHHTNTALPMHLDVAATLASIERDVPSRRRARRGPDRPSATPPLDD